MLYKIDGKYYIKVQGRYKQVDLSKNDGEIVIKPNGNKLDAYNIMPIQVSLEQALEEINRHKVVEKIEKIKEEK